MTDEREEGTEDRPDDDRPHEVPGSSGPDEPGYEGRVTVGEEGEQGDDPFGRPDPGEEQEATD